MGNGGNVTSLTNSTVMPPAVDISQTDGTSKTTGTTPATGQPTTGASSQTAKFISRINCTIPPAGEGIRGKPPTDLSAEHTVSRTDPTPTTESGVSGQGSGTSVRERASSIGQAHLSADKDPPQTTREGVGSGKDLATLQREQSVQQASKTKSKHGSRLSRSSSKIAKEVGLRRSSSSAKAGKSSPVTHGTGIHVTYDASKATQSIGDYRVPVDPADPEAGFKSAERPELSAKAEAALYKGCVKGADGKSPTEKRTAFLEKFAERMRDVPPAEKTADGENPTTTLLEFFGGDEELLQLYKDAVAEERNSTEFRDAVMAAASEKQDTNPCPGQKMVMYVGGPSAAGKSFTRGKFVDKVRQRKQEEAAAAEKAGKPLPAETGKDSYVVSVDGGLDRELCQMRQMVLQSALAKGYAGIEDLQSNTKTSVKGHVKKAAMSEGNHMHVVIPATFISGLMSFRSMFSKLGKRKDVFQVFAEVRADHTGELSSDKADKSFQKTIRYNGDSRANNMTGEPPISMGQIFMNNRNIGFESKKYQPKYFGMGVKMSKVAKEFFLRSASSKRSLVLSNESDNMHVKVKEDGRIVQTTRNPTVKHVSRREVALWHAVKRYDTEGKKQAIHSFGIPDGERKPDVEDKILQGDMQYKDKDGNMQKVESFSDFMKFLNQNKMRAQLKISVGN